MLFFFNKERRILSKNRRILSTVNKLEEEYSKLSQDEMLDIAEECQRQIAATNYHYETNSRLYMSCASKIMAIVREICIRIRNERPFNSQIIAALCLNDRSIIEMQTGQGKTLTAVLSAIYRSLYNTKVHIITANDYLAERDYDTMRKIYEYLNITVDYISKNTTEKHKIQAYKKQIVYISNQDIGFDYLRSNMTYSKNDVMIEEEDFQHAIVDEADSILLDNARIPIVIGVNLDNKYEDYYKIAYKIVSKLREDDVVINFKEKDIYIKQSRIHIVESYIASYFKIQVEEIYDDENIDCWFYIDRALRAKYFFRKNYEYIVSNLKVYSIDEYTGRVAKDRKYSDGIQQAIETKENVNITPESIHANYITTQNIYRKYKYLSGMTGTAYTEKKELEIVYKTPVVKVEKEEGDNVVYHREKFFISKQNKYNAIVRQIKTSNDKLQPVLIGTSNIYESEELSNLLKAVNIEHHILNAKKLHQEAEIIADAGIPGRVTIATNIAGRGTDIKLGGNTENKLKKFLENNADASEEDKHEYMMKIEKEQIATKKQAESVNGLLVIICQRQENRRIDRQFKGRTGRRNDIGEVMCFTSLEDEIFKNTKTDTKIASIFVEDDINGSESVLLEYLLDKIQRQIEITMFESRIKILNYDHMLSKNREIFFKIRNSVLRDNVDFVDSTQLCIKKLNDMYIYEEQFIKIYKKYINNKIKSEINNELAIKYINKIYENIKQTRFIEKNYTAIKLKYLSSLDMLWSEFINSKEIIKKLSHFNHKVDYILDYSTQLCKLFEKIMKDYDFMLLQSVYNSYIEYKI